MTEAKDPEQRAQLASFRQAGSVGALWVTGVAFMPIVMAVGGNEHSRVGFASAALAMAVVGVMGFFACFKGTTEAVPVIRDESERITPMSFVKTVVGNRALIALIVMTVFSISAYNIKPAMLTYFSKYNLHNIHDLSIVNSFAIGASIIAIISMPFLVKIMGKKNTALLGFAIAAVADGINFLIPTNTVTFTILYGLSFVGVALPNGITWAMVSDVIDYGNYKNGVRREGITYSMFNFSRKIAQALAAGMAGFGLSLIGYRENFLDDASMSAEQAASILTGIKGLQTLYPCIALTLAGLTLLFLYPLSEAKNVQIINAIAEREAKKINAGEVSGPQSPVIEEDMAAAHEDTPKDANVKEDADE